MLCTSGSFLKYCKPYLKEVCSHMKRISEEQGLDVPSVEPQVTLQIPAAGEFHLIVRLPVKSDQRSFMEQSILSEVFSKIDFTAKSAEGEKPADTNK